MDVSWAYMKVRYTYPAAAGRKGTIQLAVVFIYTIVASSQYFSRLRQPFPVPGNYPQKSF